MTLQDITTETIYHIEHKHKINFIDKYVQTRAPLNAYFLHRNRYRYEKRKHGSWSIYTVYTPSKTIEARCLQECCDIDCKVFINNSEQQQIDYLSAKKLYLEIEQLYKQNTK